MDYKIIFFWFLRRISGLSLYKIPPPPTWEIHKIMEDEEYKNRFEKLYQSLTRAHLFFYVWKGLQNKAYQPQFDKDKNFWVATMFSLEEAWLQALSNIFENSKYSEQSKVISVYSLIDNQKDVKRKARAEEIIAENGDTLKNLAILRHHQLSHYNAQHLLNPGDILKKFPIKYGAVEKILGITEELLHCLHPESIHSYSFDGFNEESERSSKLVMKRIGHFLKEEKKHYDKLRSEGDMRYVPFSPDEEN